MHREQYEPERRKDYPVLFEKLQKLTDALEQEKNQWSFFGFNVKDIKKLVVWAVLGVWWGAGFYNKLDAYEADTRHLMTCNDNRDKWATAKYGHPFDCGKPTDGWSPNMGNLKP